MWDVATEDQALRRYARYYCTINKEQAIEKDKKQSVAEAVGNRFMCIRLEKELV